MSAKVSYLIMFFSLLGLMKVNAQCDSISLVNNTKVSAEIVFKCGQDESKTFSISSDTSIVLNDVQIVKNCSDLKGEWCLDECDCFKLPCGRAYTVHCREKDYSAKLSCSDDSGCVFEVR